MDQPKRILCITPNVSVDRTLIVPGFRAGQVWRAAEARAACGGKGVNVARAAHLLGLASVCVGMVAGPTGRLAADLARQEGLTGAWTWLEGDSRTCVIVVDPECGQETVINGLGVAVGTEDWQRFKADILHQSRDCDAICLCGSLPPGCPPEDLAGMVQQMRASGRPVVVDCSGRALAEAARGLPTAIKINALEAGELLGRLVVGLQAAAAAAKDMVAQGIELAIVTLGAEGAVLASDAGAWYAAPPPLQAVSALGSGDSFLGGFVHALLSGYTLPECLRQGIATGSATALQAAGAAFDPADYGRILPQVRVERLPI